MHNHLQFLNFQHPRLLKNFPPKLSTCSFDAILTSVAKTIPPILFAVAIACNPATPAPTTKIFAAGIVPKRQQRFLVVGAGVADTGNNYLKGMGAIMLLQMLGWHQKSGLKV